MKLSQDEKNTIRHQFDCYCKKILREESRNIKKSLANQAKNDVFFAALVEERMMYYTDHYPSEMFAFEVLTYRIEISNESLAKALQNLSQEKREIILLAYFLDMTDREIAAELGIARATVQRKRSKTLQYIKEWMSRENDEK